MEELLLKKLDFWYQEAILKIVSSGYDEETVLGAILLRGHCLGSMDVLSNIMNNAVAHLNGSGASVVLRTNGFVDLRHLEEYSIDEMVSLLRLVRPGLSRGEALWCLLMCDLNVRQASLMASVMDIPASLLPLPSSVGPSTVNFRPLPSLPLANSGSSLEPPNNKAMHTLLNSLETMSLEDEGAKSSNKELILDVIRQIRELQVQVEERKEWAQQKALQAARKLSNDMKELRMLRMEQQENRMPKKGKQEMEEATLKHLSEMESAIDEALQRLVLENAEMRAEMEAHKLSASESAKKCAEVSKRENKGLNKLAAWEKQKEKMQEEIAEDKKKIVEMQQRIDQVTSAAKENEVMWRQEKLAKE